jgi:hypothetical protein
VKTAEGKWKRALGGGARLQVVKGGESGAGRFTAFSSISEWKASVRKGHAPSCAGVLRPFAEGVRASGTAVLCVSGKGPAGDEKLAAALSEKYPGRSFLPFAQASLPGGGLLFTLAPDTGPVLLALASGMPVAFAANQAISELVGFGGVAISGEAAPLDEVFAHLGGLALCVDPPSRQDHEMILEKISALAARGVLPC